MIITRIQLTRLIGTCRCCNNTLDIDELVFNFDRPAKECLKMNCSHLGADRCSNLMVLLQKIGSFSLIDPSASQQLILIVFCVLHVTSLESTSITRSTLCAHCYYAWVSLNNHELPRSSSAHVTVLWWSPVGKLYKKHDRLYRWATSESSSLAMVTREGAADHDHTMTSSCSTTTIEKTIARCNNECASTLVSPTSRFSVYDTRVAASINILLLCSVEVCLNPAQFVCFFKLFSLRFSWLQQKFHASSRDYNP